MLKYLYTSEIFREVPGEISLGISITGCTIHCKGCHSRELWEDKGTILSMAEFQELLTQHNGITCVCLFGGEHDIDALATLFMYAHQRIKTAWYCGLDMIPKEKIGIIDYLDYVKLGHYDMELGGLNSPTTNQRLYKFNHLYDDVTILGAGWKNITYLLQKKN